jgi:hypothetical protein
VKEGTGWQGRRGRGPEYPPERLCSGAQGGHQQQSSRQVTRERIRPGAGRATAWRPRQRGDQAKRAWRARPRDGRARMDAADATAHAARCPASSDPAAGSLPSDSAARRVRREQRRRGQQARFAMWSVRRSPPTRRRPRASASDAFPPQRPPTPFNFDATPAVQSPRQAPPPPSLPSSRPGAHCH